MWSTTTITSVYSQINKRIPPPPKAWFKQISRLPGKCVILIEKTKFSTSIVSLTNSTVNIDTEDPPFPPPLCPPNSLSCKDSVSLGRTANSEKVNSGWPSRLGQSGIPVEARRLRRVPLQKEGGEIVWVRNPVPSPAGCILDPGGDA